MLSDKKHFLKWNRILVEPGHPALNQPATINPFSTLFYWRAHETEMLALMKRKKGIGLAAPQLGNSIKMFVMEHSELGGIGIYNPEILASGKGKETMAEGCLSFPGLFIPVTRPKSILVRFYDKNQEERMMELDGIDARCFQHEYDHLQGKLFTEYT